MKTFWKYICTGLILALLTASMILPAWAAGESGTDAPAAVQTEEQESSGKALAAALVVGIAAGAGAIAMGMAIAKSVDGIARQPESEGQIRTTLMLGLVFVETAIIYGLIVAILIIFVL